MAHAPAAPTTDWSAAVILLDDTLRRLGQRLTSAEADLRLARHNYEALVDASLRSVGQLPCAARLTTQELRVANLVAAGMSNREVADALQVSVHTVKTHVKNVLAKLSLRSRWQITAMVGQPTLVAAVELPSHPATRRTQIVLVPGAIPGGSTGGIDGAPLRSSRGHPGSDAER